ncbi:MAG: PhnD/SsuA/transferrin family substrate-binding protein [Goleter apudmare HA4340-LM2]|jgi:phosphonate transport system substrate-binding protein|nr:PhnD/SsuA/transferrin family substrate-binding protein [Goleter apudmare HA4340-LM2]
MKRRNFLSSSLLFVAGCSAVTGTRSSPSQVNIPNKLRFSVTDAKGIKELQRDYEPFRAALEKILETKIEFFPVENILATVPAMLSGQVDLTWAGPSEYVVLHARAQAKPVVRLNRLKYHTVIVVSAKSPIKSLNDLQGKTLDVWRMGGAAGHLGAIELLLDAGVQPSEVKTIALDKSSLQPLKNGAVDAQSMSLVEYKNRLKVDKFSESEFLLLAQGPPLPGDVFAVSSQLEPQVTTAIGSRMLKQQDQLMQAILSVEALTKFQGTTMTTAIDEDFDMIRKAYRAIGQEKVIQ